jgi:rod shape determining protein RodA
MAGDIRDGPAGETVMVTRWRARWAGTDPVLVLSAAVLVTIGVLSVYAATRNHLAALGRPSDAYLMRDVVNVALGIAVAAPVALLDYRQLRPWTPIGYGGLAFLLLAVLSPLGTSVNGAHGWFALGPLQLEPSEFMKVGLILLLAGLLSDRQDREPGPETRKIVLALAAAGLPVLLVLAEPALGVAITLAAITLTLVALSGAPARWTYGLLGTALVVGTLGLSLHLLKPYQEERFTAFTDPTVQHSSAGYQLEQSKIAIGSGGVLGQGFLAGSQTDGGFIPEQQTDFIFTVTAEEGGLVGGSLLLLALGALLWRGVDVCLRAKDLYGRLIAGGVVIWFAFQAFVNIGMTLGIAPVTGVPLPFVSYGGSALFANMLGLALLLSVARVARVTTSGQTRLFVGID